MISVYSRNICLDGIQRRFDWRPTTTGTFDRFDGKTVPRPPTLVRDQNIDRTDRFNTIVMTAAVSNSRYRRQDDKIFSRHVSRDPTENAREKSIIVFRWISRRRCRADCVFVSIRYHVGCCCFLFCFVCFYEYVR